MKSATIRLIIILALFTSAGIIILQTYWVRRAVALQEREFNVSVNTALHNVAVDVMKLKDNQAPIYSPVEKIKPDYYVAQTNVFIEKEVLEHLLVAEFTKQLLLTDFEYGLYDCMSDTVQYKGYVHMAGSADKPVKPMDFPSLKRENYYFSVHFPHRRHYLTSELTVWIISSLILLCVLTFLGYLLIIIFKQKRLREIQKDFVSNMTHEFKTPLATIQISAEVLKEPAIIENPQRLLNYAAIISNEAVLLNKQVERVLQTARAEKGHLILKKESFTWQDLVLEVVPGFESVVESRGGTLTLHLPDTPIHYKGDILHLKNAISNLIDNGIKYSEDTPCIVVTLERTGSDIRISVEDKGIGIDKQHQKMLFQRFYRVPTGNVHNVKGFGLGLNFVQIITKAHNGAVIYSSKLGKGTIFTLSFPLIN